MKVLVIGSGGREHAIAWRLAQAARVSEVLVAPGNAGTEREPKCRNVPVSAMDLDGLVRLVRAESVTLTVVGPEGPLAAGVVDRFRAEGLRIFGPTQAAAQLESSKAFTKDFLARHGIPTAAYCTFTEADPAIAYVRTQGAPIVIKADGLAAGKGVVVAMTLDEAESAVRDMLSGNLLGQAGSRVVIEAFLVGEEASFICMVDGQHALPLVTSQDHKRVFDGDQGPNTGGMGAYSPAPVVTAAVHAHVMQDIILPTINGMAADGIPFTGFLYAGLMINAEGRAKVIEFNARMGDPETQVIMLRLQSDFSALLEAGIDGRLGAIDAEWTTLASVGVVMAAEHYPGTVPQGDVIAGLEAGDTATVKVFHAGTRSQDGQVVTAGGRVLTVCALAPTIRQAAEAAYARANTINWRGEQHRTDIGWRGIAREQAVN